MKWHRNSKSLDTVVVVQLLIAGNLFSTSSQQTSMLLLFLSLFWGQKFWLFPAFPSSYRKTDNSLYISTAALQFKSQSTLNEYLIIIQHLLNFIMENSVAKKDNLVLLNWMWFSQFKAFKYQFNASRYQWMDSGLSDSIFLVQIQWLMDELILIWPYGY